MNHKSDQQTNSLINETSPYLLQHAYNPVDWYAWGEDALAKAKQEDKLLIISIGYSACHWCHVMEHESFEDSLVAEYMNQHFVSIKVDREERPDVDDVYMTACNLISGRGGWPLNAIALPDGRPIWAGTYFPKDQWMQVLRQFVELKGSDYQRLVETAEKLVMGLQQVDEVVDVSSELEFTEEGLEAIGNRFISNVDFVNGGIKSSQKFPLPSSYEFLLKYAYKYPESRAREAVEVTLGAMMNGGIYDQIEGGFARYTVDNKWKIPHFEKMLYDNAQLVSLYSKAYKMTGRKGYLNVVQETIDFMQNNWKDESGGYYSSYDADSEGEEGKFYVWTYSELVQIIPADEFEAFREHFNVTKSGNWEEGINILFVKQEENEESNIRQEQLSKWKNMLQVERSKREFPGLDDKILCSWNAMLLNGYVEAFKATGNENYREEAIAIWKFIESNLLDKDKMRLNRNFKDGSSTINAFLDDYAQVIAGLINLYQITFQESYLLKAAEFTDYIRAHFQNSSSAMFNYTSDLDPPLVATKAELSDGVVPGSNSLTAQNLYKLGLFLYNQSYIDQAYQMMRNMKNSVEESGQPNFYANWCSLYFDLVYEPYEVAILGPDYGNLNKAMQEEYHPNALFLGGSQEGSLKLLEDKLQEGENFIYVCINKSCKLPVQTAEEALKLLD